MEAWKRLRYGSRVTCDLGAGQIVQWPSRTSGHERTPDDFPQMVEVRFDSPVQYRWYREPDRTVWVPLCILRPEDGTEDGAVEEPVTVVVAERPEPPAIGDIAIVKDPTNPRIETAYYLTDNLGVDPSRGAQAAPDSGRPNYWRFRAERLGEAGDPYTLSTEDYIGAHHGVVVVRDGG